ncbi:MAG: ABC transporter ATP-binding protein [Pseudomonadota bacterium]|nr:ABC transporter ATP-binding protein [Pseudomonadota bacterium]
MIRIEQLSKIFRSELVETHALRAFDLQVASGEFVSITGPSASGKTTLLNILGLLETQTSGLYELDGVDVKGLSDVQRSKVRNEKIGFVFQSFNMISGATIYQNVDIPLRYGGIPRSQRHDRIVQCLSRVGLGGRMHHLPSEISGGQLQRAAIARALVGSPKVLLADEPTGNLDSHMAVEILDLIEEINSQGTTVVLVTHDEKVARRTKRNIHVLDGTAMEVCMS